jgi:hypothetical protein
MVQGVESSQDLARKLEVLERELAVQRSAMEKLKQLGAKPVAAAGLPEDSGSQAGSEAGSGSGSGSGSESGSESEISDT